MISSSRPGTDSLIPGLEILDQETIEVGYIRYELDSVDIWVKNSIVVQLAALDDYTGTINGKVGIGTYIKDIASRVVKRGARVSLRRAFNDARHAIWERGRKKISNHKRK